MITKTRGRLKGVVSIGLEPWTTEVITKTRGRLKGMLSPLDWNYGPVK